MKNHITGLIIGLGIGVLDSGLRQTGATTNESTH